MINIEAIKNAFPEEQFLCELIENDLMGVVADESITEKQLRCIINAVYLYKNICDNKIRVFVVGGNSTPLTKMFMEEYTVSDCFEFVRFSDNDKMLTSFLGSEAIIVSNPDSNGAKLAKEFYVPRICLFDRDNYEYESNILYVNTEPSSIAAALMIIKERKYTDDLSGHKRLV